MQDFVKILNHGRRLQAAVKGMAVSELREVVEKLNKIIERQELKEAEERKEEQQKLEKIEQIKKEMEAAGIDWQDVLPGAQATPPKQKGKKRPIKYRIVDADGEETLWTGIGRMPLVFKAQIDAGKKLEDFRI